MERYKEPDNWLRAEGLNVNLSKLTDQELGNLTEFYRGRQSQVNYALEQIDREHTARALSTQETLDFFGNAPEVVSVLGEDHVSL